MSDTEHILTAATAWRREGRGVALATVVTTWGSSPRPVGSKLAVDAAGSMLGSVSGGCVEGAVVEAALDIIRSGAPRLLEFGVSDEQAWDVGLACGGRVQIFVEKLSKLALLERLLMTDRAGTAAALITNLATGAQSLVTATGARDAMAGGSEDLAHGCEGDLVLGAGALAQVLESLQDDRSRTIETETGAVFIEVWNPKLRLVVVGAVHIAQALVPLAQLAGYDVTVIDPRTAFGTPARFPNTTLSNEWPDEALRILKPDRRTAILTLTHDPKIDDPALQAALQSTAFFVGSLGSRRTHAKRIERLREAGFTAADIARIRGPVGLAIGAQTPVEIAISILAEITAVLRRSALATRV